MLFKKALIGRKGKLQAFLCGVFLNAAGEFGTPDIIPVVGAADGHLYIFREYELVKTVKAHESFVNTIVATKSGLLVSGGRDGLVKLWRYAEDILESTHSFDVRNLKSSLYTRVRAVDVNESEGRILVGTQGSEIYEISLVDGANLNGTGALIKGHYKSQLWGLSTHPTKPNYATLGDDGVVRIWDAMLFKEIKHLALDTGGRAIGYDTTGTLIAVGLG